MTTNGVQLEVYAFNNRAPVRNLEKVCRNVNAGSVILPDGRRLVMTVEQRLHCQRDGPLAQTGYVSHEMRQLRKKLTPWPSSREEAAPLATA